MYSDSEVRQGLALLSANYLKRILERQYDRAMATNLGQKLKSLDPKARYGIEFGLNLLAVFFDKTLAGDTVLKRLVKEVGLDAAPEISKRLINHGAHAVDDHEKELLQSMLALPSEDLVRLLKWLFDVDSKHRTRVIQHMGTLSTEELATVADLKVAEREQLFELFAPRDSPSTSSAVAEGLDEATASLRAFRARLRRKREGGHSNG